MPPKNRQTVRISHQLFDRELQPCVLADIGIGDADGPNYYATRANFRIERDGRQSALHAERRFYPGAGSPTTEVGIASGLDGDLYVALGEPSRGGAAWAVRLYINPLVQFIFGGAALMALGGALSLLSLARRRRMS